MSGELGNASLDLEANLGPFERNLETAHVASDRLEHALDALAAVADVCQKALNDVKLDSGQAARSRLSAEQILSGVHGISDESRTAARELDKVKLSQEQALETDAAGDVIDHKLDEIRDKAVETQLALDRVRLRLDRTRGGGGGLNRPGYGVGPFGAGYGRLGVVGTLVGLGAATAPAAGPAALGLLAGIPALATMGVGALGTLALAFDGVTKAIGGDKKAFEDLSKPAQEFVRTVRSLDGLFDRLRKTAAVSLFPGITAGLKAALSPGTVNAVFTAVTELGKALGHVAQEFGRYFGSAEFQKIFGPLMASAARNIKVMGDAALHLFDALGVLMRAAIPFVNWLTSAIDKGAKLADSWIHAKAASGGLASALDKAKGSLTLIAKLAGALITVVVQLGKALYPISSRVLKDLTGGLSAVGKAVGVLAPALRGALGGALSVVEAAVKTVWPAVETLLGVLLKLIGVLGHALVPIIHALQPVFKALQRVFKELEPPLAKVIKDVVGGLAPAVKALAKPLGDVIKALGPILVGALKVLDPLLKLAAYLIATVATAFGVLLEVAAKALTYIEKKWRTIVVFFKTLGKEILNAFEYVWYELEKNALKAALAVVEPFSHLPSFLGGWARKAKNSMQTQLDKIKPPNMNWHDVAAAQGAQTGKAWSNAFNSAALQGHLRIGPGGDIYPTRFSGSDPHHHRRHHHGANPKPGTHAWYIKMLGYDPTLGPTFGPQPPFTKNTGSSGSRSAIPQSVSQLDALAARQDQQAAALHYAGKKAREHLLKEINDLEQADKILEEKIKHSHGKTRTALYNQLTANLKKIAEARKRVHDAAALGRQAALNYALDAAKLAVEKAKQGSKAWDLAIAAEEKALRAEIRYWDKVAHDTSLSKDARDKALKKELAYQHELNGLLKQNAQAAVANEKQFLTTFADIQNSFAPNGTPLPTPGPGKTDTHLHEIKNEARKTNQHLAAMRRRHRHHASDANHDAAMAVG